MKPIVGAALGLILFVAISALVLHARKRANTRRPWPFYLKRLMTQPEQVLFHRLVRALPDHVILAQVQVSRVLGVKKGVGFHEWNNRINRLSYDFVVCSRDASVIAAIELDDKSHDSASRGETDARKDKASADAGLRLVRWHVRDLPDEDLIRRVLDTSTPLEPSGSAQA